MTTNSILHQQIHKHFKGHIPENLLPFIKDIERGISEVVANEANQVNWYEHLQRSQSIAKIGSWEADITSQNFEGVKGLFWSDEFYKILGYEIGKVEVSMENFSKAMHPEDIATVQAAFENMIKAGDNFDLEHRLIMLDGTVKTVHSKGQMSWRNAKPYRLVGTSQDITILRNTNDELIATGKKLKVLFNNMKEIFFSVHYKKQETLFISPSCEQTYGYKQQEFMEDATLWFKVIVDEDRERIIAEESLLKEGQRLEQEYRIKHKDGSIHWLESVIFPTLDKEGNLHIIDGFVNDITERKKAEEALKASEYKLRSMISQSSDAITITGSDLKFSFGNDSLFRMSGYSSLDEFSMDIVHPEDVEPLKIHLQWLLHHPEEPAEMTFRLRKKNGVYLWVERVSINKLNDPVINGIVSNFRDITERKTHLDTLQRTNDELRKTNMELDKFVYRVSHDLRAPLLSVMGLIELAKTDSAEAIPEYLDMMQSSVEKLDGFIKDILDYSRNVRDVVTKEHIDLHHLVNGIKDQLKFIDSGNDSVIIKNNIPEALQLNTDKRRLSIILNNLLSNAIRYYDPAISDPCVELIASPLPGNKISISVKDNGIGIAAEHHPKIFDMFYRASKKSSGSGLGLYIVKESVEKLNGEIELISSAGMGAEFKFSLPAN